MSQFPWVRMGDEPIEMGGVARISFWQSNVAIEHPPFYDVPSERKNLHKSYGDFQKTRLITGE